MNAAAKWPNVRKKRAKGGCYFEVVYRTRRARAIWIAAASGVSGYDVETFGKLPLGARSVCHAIASKVLAFRH